MKFHLAPIRTRHVVIAILASFVSACALAQQTIGRADCLVFNPLPVPDESVEWTGGCQDGYADGDGILTLHVPGKADARFEGTLLRGRRNGQGIQRDPGGRIFKGVYINGNLHGKVRIELEHVFAVDAVFEHGAITEPVTAGYTSGDQYRGGWGIEGPEGNGTMQFASGGSFTGTWVHGRMHGSGTVIYPNGIQRAVHADGTAGLPDVRSDHRLGRDAASMFRFKPLAYNSPVPFKKAYAELAPDEQHIVRGWFPVLQSDDIPPYPVNGTAGMVKAIAAAHAAFNSSGRLLLDVLIDEHGAPQSVAIRHTPDMKIAEFAGKVLLLSKYTPASCGGRPCAMRFPLALDLQPPE